MLTPNQESMLTDSQKLVKALGNPDLYEHPVGDISIIETHISWVILTGHYAYKIKKPVDFGFVDFTTLKKRLFFCEEELRLNRRFSNNLYLQTIAIHGEHSKPRFSGDGDIIEYAVKMREFPQHSLLSCYAAESRLKTEHIDSMASVIANIHEQAPRAASGSSLGSAQTIDKWSDENFQQIEDILTESLLPDYFETLKAWSQQKLFELLTFVEARQRQGYVRECHGDLHLSNMAFLNNQCTPFDCIEFNEELRWIDTISEVAFVIMDLQAGGYREFSWRFVNRYLAISGDYSGLAILPYYLVYRALVRAKVAALAGIKPNFKHSLHYLDLAQSWSLKRRPILIAMHGLSGSGKSTVAEDLASRLGAIQIRSDIERKRLFNLEATAKSDSSINTGIYGKDASQQTYDKLVNIAENLLSSGFNVIVDAACLKSSQRALFSQLAERLRIPGFLISCKATEQDLRQRITKRLKAGSDASEANLGVLANQLRTQQTLTSEECENSNTLICHQPKLGDEQFKLISTSTKH